jgi:hypothetical protein
LQYPSLTIHPKKGIKKEDLYQSLAIRKAERDGPSEYGHHLATICDHLKIEFDMKIELQRYGKCKIPGDITLRSRISEQGGQASHSSRYFEASNLPGKKKPIIGEALAFYFVPEHNCSLVVYHQLGNMKEVLGEMVWEVVNRLGCVGNTRSKETGWDLEIQVKGSYFETTCRIGYAEC